MIDVVTFETGGLGNRSYLATDGDVAVAVDPQRDVERVLTAADDRGVAITHVLETHLHNDYVTGGLVLARELGATYAVPAGEPVGYDRFGVVDGQHLEVGAMAIEAIATPGHTPTHLAYVLRDGDRVVGVFTGGSMLFGATGRTDLFAAELTERLTGDQHRSVRRLAAALPDEAAVYPTHGFGSFCAATSVSRSDGSTIAVERDQNPALQLDREGFIARMLDSYDVFPAYYAHMSPLNRAGPAPIDRRAPEHLSPEEVRRRVRQDLGWVVDLRDRGAYAAAHLRGTVAIEGNDRFATYYGWLAPWGAPLTLLAEDHGQVASVQLALARIGIDRPHGVLVGDVRHWLDDDDGAGSYRVADFEDLARADGPLTVLDVRRDREWEEAHLAGALHIPIHELEARLDEVPGDREVWVHCASGYRASIAASMLDGASKRPVLIDDSWRHARESDDLEVV